MPKWKLKTEFTFDSSHYIKDYNGPCGRIHGHTYRVKIEATSNQLYPSEYCPHPVMVADFKSLRWAKQDVDQGGLDHCVLNDVLPQEYSTTAEMIAQFIYDETKKRLPEGVKLKICVSETPNSWAEYEDEQYSNQENWMSQLRTLVVTSCTGEKQAKPRNPITLEDFQDTTRLTQREFELSEYACFAGQMYTGAQHLRLMEGVRMLRDSLGEGAIDLSIVSAGYGLIAENKTIVPYEVTFNTMKGSEVDAWAQSLKIREEFEQLITSYELIFILLGENYLRALSLPISTQLNQTFVFLASQGSKAYIPKLTAQSSVMTLSNVEAKFYGYGLVGLKGFLFKQFAQQLIKRPELLSKVHCQSECFEEIIKSARRNDKTENSSIQLGIPLELPEVKTKKKARLDNFLPIPDCPPAPNIHLGMQYFIPEWDDRVDPNIDGQIEVVS